MSNEIFMPKAIAVWLIENTKLTFAQIATFVGVHEYEIQILADKEDTQTQSFNPITANLLTANEIARCEENPQLALASAMKKDSLIRVKRRSGGPRYTTLTKRGLKPDAIAWLLKKYPDMKERQIMRLLGTTKKTIENIKVRIQKSATSLDPRSPADLELCSYVDLQEEIQKIPKPTITETTETSEHSEGFSQPPSSDASNTSLGEEHSDTFKP